MVGCAAGQNKSAAAGQAYAGWYIEQVGHALFQPCGQPRPWTVTAPADLPARARAFGLQQDTPVYVRVIGAAQGDAIAVSSVEQFGSSIPIRNCAMNGVVTSARIPE